MQTLTGKAPYTGPVGTLLRLLMHKDSEIAEHVYCFILSVHVAPSKIN